MFEYLLVCIYTHISVDLFLSRQKVYLIYRHVPGIDPAGKISSHGIHRGHSADVLNV